MNIGDERLPRRVWKKLNVDTSGHWIWTGRKDSKGYGSFTFDGRRRFAHRVMLKVETGFYGEYALHSCNTPLCCNPGHLRWGNNSENQKDSVLAGTHHEARKTHCVNGHLYTQETTYIRPDRGSRGCRICRTAQSMKYQRRRDMSKKSGWCLTRKHENCPSTICDCDCHEREET